MNIKDTLRYKSSAHDRARRALMAYYSMSLRAMQERHPNWKRSDEDFRAYTPESSEDSRRKTERSSGKLQYTTLTIPLTYAMSLTAHTYWSSVFFNRSPVFQLGIRKGDVEQATQPMEALLDYQVMVGKLLVPMMVWLMDPCRYGFGVLRTYWDREIKRIAYLEEGPALDELTGMPIPGRTSVNKKTQEIPGYQGNRAYNVRPYNFFPDTRVPLIDFQKGTFCADTTYRNFQSLKANDAYMNMDALSDIVKDGSGTQQAEAGAEQLQMPDYNAALNADSELTDKGSVHILNMVVEIIPKDWNLGPETKPEKWMFELAEEKVIINAEPFGHLHDEYPYDVIFYEVDGYVLDIRGMMEIGKDLNTAASWLVNSHMFNVRRALNDQLVVDPSRIVMKDALDGGPGKVIRLKPTAYGTSTKDVVSQLKVTDITRQNIGDTQSIRELLQQILGVNDNVMGTLDPGGRKTATEVRTASTFSISRLKTIAEFFSATGFTPLTQKLVQNTQQFYFQGGAKEEVFKVVGDMAANLDSVRIDPQSIAGFYDFVPVDGTLPIDRMAQANLWKEILMILVQTGAYNVEEIVNWIANLSGIRGMKRFKLQVAPDAQVAAQAQKGNLVPLRQRGGDGSLG